MSLEKKLSPLFRLAIKSGAVDAVALHVRRGESLNGRDMSGLTPLMIAAIHNQQESCAALLALGADASVLSAAGKTASELAFDLGHLTLAKVLSTPHTSSADEPAEPSPALDSRSGSFRDSCTIEISPVDVHGSQDEGARTVASPHVANEAVHEAAPAGCSDEEEELNGWAVDVVHTPPVHDSTCVAAAREVQRRISEHRRVSDEFDWSDAEFELPEARVRTQPLQLDHTDAIRGRLATALQTGYVTTLELNAVLERGFPQEVERARGVLERILDDLGILIEADGLPLASAGADVAGDDELLEAMQVLHDELAEPVDSASVSVREARRYDLIKREDEERLGRRMDSALGALTRALASLPDSDWRQVFAQHGHDATAPVSKLDEDDRVDESEPVTSDELVDEGEGEGGDYRSYVERVRQGEPEHGRDAAVPRPSAPDLKRLLAAAVNLEASVVDAVRSSIGAYEAARNQLVTANLRLAASLANNYRNSELPFEDRIQEASIGLLRAAERYDFRRGFKFSTYATWWIRQAVTRGIADTARAIRIPVHQVERINVVNRARRELEIGRSGEVSVLEIATRLSMPVDQVCRIVRADVQTVSLEECGPGLVHDAPASSDIIDPSDGPWERACERSLALTIERMLDELDPRSREVMVARFGFDGEGERTLEEVGRQFDVTRERIRQIEAKALRQLRHPNRSDILAPFAATPRPEHKRESK